MANRKLKNWIDGYKEYMKGTEAPTKYIEWAAVSAIAAAAQRKVVLHWGTEELYPNFYIILVGDPAARKGTAVGPALKILRELELNIAAETTSFPALVRRLKEGEQITTLENGEQTIHCSMTVFSPEFTVFFNGQDPKMLSGLTDMYDCRDPWIYDTKNVGTDDIPAVWLNLLGCTTPRNLENLKMDTVGSGLSSRIIYVFESHAKNRSPFNFFADTEEGKKLYSNLVSDLELIRQVSGKAKFTDEYLTAYGDWYSNMPYSCPFDPARFNHYWARRQTHLRKLSIIMNLSRDGKLALSREDFDSALKLLSDTEKKMQLAFSGVGDSRYAKFFPEIYRLLKVKGAIPVSKLQREFLRDLTVQELELAIKSLTLAKIIRVVTTSRGQVIELIDDGCKDEK